MSSQIQHLQQAKQTALQQLHKSQNTQYKVLERANGMNLSIIFLIVLSIEILILLANWFLIFYDFKTQKESDTLQFGQNQILVSSSDFGQMVRQYFLSMGQDLAMNTNDYLLNEKPKTVGFQSFNKHSINQETLRNSKENSLPKPLNEALINDIQNGIYDIRTLTKKHKVNVRTAKLYLDQYKSK